MFSRLDIARLVDPQTEVNIAALRRVEKTSDGEFVLAELHALRTIAVADHENRPCGMQRGHRGAVPHELPVLALAYGREADAGRVGGFRYNRRNRLRLAFSEDEIGSRDANYRNQQSCAVQSNGRKPAVQGLWFYMRAVDGWFDR
ncbi:MAG TPA: hypothetical protein VGF59_21645 [Bryobacteraceae bacterium]